MIVKPMNIEIYKKIKIQLIKEIMKVNKNQNRILVPREKYKN